MPNHQAGAKRAKRAKRARFQGKKGIFDDGVTQGGLNLGFYRLCLSGA